MPHGEVDILRRVQLLALTALVVSSTPARAQVECNGVTCTVGDACYQDACVPPCKNGEFPCSGGTTCFSGPDLNLRQLCANPGVDDCYCLEPLCAIVVCERGWICHEDDGQCYDPCATGEAGCGGAFVCCGGECVDNPCYGPAFIDCFECGPCLPDLTTCPPTRFYCAGCSEPDGGATDATGPQTGSHSCGCHAGGDAAGGGLALLLVLLLRRLARQGRDEQARRFGVGRSVE